MHLVFQAKALQTDAFRLEWAAYTKPGVCVSMRRIHSTNKAQLDETNHIVREQKPQSCEAPRDWSALLSILEMRQKDTCVEFLRALGSQSGVSATHSGKASCGKVFAVAVAA